MDSLLLILNAGSSSLKFSVYRCAQRRELELDVRGQIEGIGASTRLTVRNATGEKLADEKLNDSVRDGRSLLESLTLWLDSNLKTPQIVGVGHRIVHGGEKFSVPTIVTRAVLTELEALIPLAPLHQPHNLAPIRACFERMPDVPQVACFDTAFHRGRSEVSKLVPLPKRIRQHGVQRYGLHGISYQYIASMLPLVAPDIAKGRIIVAHLGNGASLCAMKNLQSVDTTMSFTALDGLCMGTRGGSLDPGIVLYLFQNLGLSVPQVEEILYKQSGLLGISEMSNDMRVLLRSTDPQARLAIDYFLYRAAKEIGSLVALLGGLDALIFTAGIGENSPAIRQRICQAFAWLGLDLDEVANARNSLLITKPESKVSAWTIPTNEELMIAHHTKALLNLN